LREFESVSSPFLGFRIYRSLGYIKYIECEEIEENSRIYFQELGPGQSTQHLTVNPIKDYLF